jgi:hypothetical protein
MKMPPKPIPKDTLTKLGKITALSKAGLLSAELLALGIDSSCISGLDTGRLLIRSWNPI